MSVPTVAIVDYGMGNLFSVQQACHIVGLEVRITSSKEDILDSDSVILPGVGAFADAMAALRERKLIEPILETIHSGKPFMGICLGMQLLFEESEEFGRHRGLGVIPGAVIRFKSNGNKKLKVPCIGWNRIEKFPSQNRNLWERSLLCGIEEGAFMYFVHSYYCVPTDKSIVVSRSEYHGIVYCSSVLFGNIFACQFHPERSGNTGLTLYKNFMKMTQRGELRWLRRKMW